MVSCKVAQIGHAWILSFSCGFSGQGTLLSQNIVQNQTDISGKYSPISTTTEAPSAACFGGNYAQLETSTISEDLVRNVYPGFLVRGGLWGSSRLQGLSVEFLDQDAKSRSCVSGAGFATVLHILFPYSAPESGTEL